jgi:hypothetical protein
MLIARWTNRLILVPAQDLSMEQWWNSSTFVQPRKERRRVAAILMYTAWNLWKERNHRILQGLSETPARVFALIKMRWHFERMPVGEWSQFYFSNVEPLYL